MLRDLPKDFAYQVWIGDLYCAVVSRRALREPEKNDLLLVSREPSIYRFGELMGRVARRSGSEVVILSLQ